MYPVEYEIKNATTKIHFVCVKCKKNHWNKSAEDDDLANLDACIIAYKSLIQDYYISS